MGEPTAWPDKQCSQTVHWGLMLGKEHFPKAGGLEKKRPLLSYLAEKFLSTLPSSTVQPAAGLIHSDVLLASFPEAKSLALERPP